MRNDIDAGAKQYILLILCIIAAMMLLLSSCTGSSVSSPDHSVQADTDGQEPVRIGIMAPSPGELTIAPGRHFKVSGVLTGEVPDDACVRVSLLDTSGQEIRYAETSQKGTDHVIPSICGGDITVLNKNTDFSDVAYTAPELAVADAGDPQATAHDATVKCVYTDETFYALIVSATDPAHGLAEQDGYELVDHEGRPYDALPEGVYTIRAVVSSSDGTELASTSEKIEIGVTNGTIIHEITSADALEKGGMDLLTAWAADENLRILGDLLPGMFGPTYQMSTLPMAVSCETAEYMSGKIWMLVYDNAEASASNAIEVARFLQLENNVENPEIARYFLFSLGEPSFAGEPSVIMEFADGENMHICRIDHVVDEAKDGVFVTTEEQVLESDTDPADGWTVRDGAFAIAGVMKPYQLRDDEVVPDDIKYGVYRFLNGADTLVYTFTPSDGSEAFSITKDVGLSRIDKADGNAAPAVYEFYNVFPAGTLEEGTDYDVFVQAYDRNNAAISGVSCSFTLSPHFS